MNSVRRALLAAILLLPAGYLQAAPGRGTSQPREPYPPGTPGVVPPVPTRKTHARYSEEATKACYEASVLLLAVVDRKGSVSSVRVLKPAGLGLDETAIAAASQWRFRPARKDAQPVAATIQVGFEFRISCSEGPRIGTGKPTTPDPSLH